MAKNLPARCGFGPWVRKNPWRRKWQPTPVFLPGKSHGQRSLADYSPWGCKELDSTERTRGTRDQIHAPFSRNTVLTTGPPGKFPRVLAK